MYLKDYGLYFKVYEEVKAGGWTPLCKDSSLNYLLKELKTLGKPERCSLVCDIYKHGKYEAHIYKAANTYRFKGIDKSNIVKSERENIIKIWNANMEIKVCT